MTTAGHDRSVRPDISSDQADVLSVVLGGTGGIGGALVRELVTRGRRVRVVSRSGRLPAGVTAGSGVESVAADVSDPEQTAGAVEAATVIYYAAQPNYTRWPLEFPLLTRAVLEGAAASRAKLVVADNLYMYGPVRGEPMTEDMPNAAVDRKGRVRAAIAQELLDSHRTGAARVTLGRAAGYYGPGGVATNYGPQIFSTALHGAPAQWIGPVDIPRTMSYLPDIARALVVLGDSDLADGRAWHLPHAPAITGQDFLRLVYARAGSLPAGGPDTDRGYAATIADRESLPYIARTNPDIADLLTEIEDIWYQLDEPYLVDTSAFERTFGPFATTPHEQAVAATLSWFRQVPQR